MSLIAAWLRIPFWQRVLAGFVLGALAGWAFGPSAETWFGPLGTLYVTLIKMIAVPLVFFAVMNAVASLHGQKSMALLGGRTFLWFAITAALAVCVGLGVCFCVGVCVRVGVHICVCVHVRICVCIGVRIGASRSRTFAGPVCGGEANPNPGRAAPRWRAGVICANWS